MNREEMKNWVGLIASVALITLLIGAWYLERPIPDRTLAVFALLLWGTLQIDISAIVPFTIVTDQDDRDTGGE